MTDLQHVFSFSCLFRRRHLKPDAGNLWQHLVRASKMLRVHINYVFTLLKFLVCRENFRPHHCLQIVLSVLLTGAQKGYVTLRARLTHFQCRVEGVPRRHFYRQKLNSQNVSKGLWYYGCISINLELGMTKVWNLVGMAYVRSVSTSPTSFFNF